MASKESFSPEEWNLIKDGPDWVYAALAAADNKAALMTQWKESAGFSKAIETYKTSNQLIRQVIEDKSPPAKTVKDASLSDAEEMLKKISALLDQKVDRQEAEAFRDFLMAVSKSIAEAAGEGFLGLGGKVSQKEASTLGKIEAALKAGEADKKARLEAEAKRQAEATRLQKEAEAKAKQEAEAKRQAEATRLQQEAEAKAKQEAEAKRQAEATRLQKEAEAKAKQEAEAKRQAEAKAKQEAEAKAKQEVKIEVKREVKDTLKQAVGVATGVEYVAEHKVVSGDTLSGLALKYYGSAAQNKWMRIYEENKQIIGDNPNLIRVGQVLKIPKLA